MATFSNVLTFPSPGGASPPVDDSAARTAALDVHQSVIVEAPAGSGKTGLLVQRFLKLLGDDATTQPEEVLAVTFTNKATAELLDRVLSQLQSAASNAPLPPPATTFEQQTRNLATAVLARDRRLGWGLLAQPRRLQVRTFDAVCLALANGLPLLSGSNGARSPALDARPLHRTAARRTLMQLGGDDAALTAALSTILLHRDGSLSNVENLLAAMLATRDQWGELIPLDRHEDHTLEDRALDQQVRPRLERALEAIVCAGLTRALNALPSHLLHELAAFAARHAELPGYKDNDSPIALCSGRSQPPEAVATHLDHWFALVHMLTLKDVKWRSSLSVNNLGFALGKSEKAELQHIINKLQTHPDCEAILEALCDVRCLPPPRYPDEQWAVAKALFVVLRHALVELKLLFAEREESDFIEFSLAARAALQDATDSHNAGPDTSPADSVLAAGSRLRHLLVDEMQDTSTAQYQLIELLTRSWDGHSQTLFLVGDPKQSIYLFRRARVERFVRTMITCRLGDITLSPLQLTANFRSQAALIDAFNTSFELIFPHRAAAASDVPFVAAQGRRRAAPGPALTWHAQVLDGKASQWRKQEALHIRILAEQYIATNPSARIAVLAASRSHLADIVSTLKLDLGAGPLAFRGIDLDPLDELPEILDLLALTRALLHPADRIAWLAVLHAPWCGLGLADLLTLTGEGPTARPDATVLTLLHERTGLLSPDARRLLARTRPTLEIALQTLGQTSLSLHLERTWRSLGGDAPLHQQALANADLYFKLLRELEADSSSLDLTVLSARLKHLYAAPATGDHIRVDLLTIHRAKGLEWDLVFVPGLERKPQGSTEDLLNWIELDDSETDASIVLAPIGGKGQDSSRLNDWLKTQRSRREAAERKRLFYVAATRAREQLHLFAALEREQDGTLCKPTSTTLLHAAWPAAQSHFIDSSPAITADEISLETALAHSLAMLDEHDQSFAMAATADTDPPSGASTEASTEATHPLIARLPGSFDPRARFHIPTAARLFPLQVAPSTAQPFARPEGSFAVRAFGNVVHRFLQKVAEQLAMSSSPAELLQQLPGWLARLRTSFRGEGLSTSAATAEAERALQALTRALEDPTGLWLLSPHPQAANESPLTTALETRSLRIDRTFLAGHTPLSNDPACIWIVDFKTTAQGSRTDAAFAASEIARYGPQMAAYAAIRKAVPGTDLPIRTALYYPLIPKLLEVPPGSL